MDSPPEMYKLVKPPSWLNQLNYLTISFRFLIQRDLVFNSFLGPEIRGSIGRQLKESYGCYADRDRDCQRCPQARRENCIYHLCFEHSGNRRKPFMLKLDPAFRSHRPCFERGLTFRFDFVLTGQAIPYAHQIMEIISKSRMRLGANGFSPEILDYGWLDKENSFISALSSKTLPPQTGCSYIIKKCPAEIDQYTLRFLTPTEITLKHGRAVKYPDDLNFRLLIARIMQRLKGLVDENEILITATDDKHIEGFLLSAAEEIVSSSGKSQWQNVKLRQMGKRYCGGLSGSINYNGRLTQFTPLLEAIELFGIGKNLTSGFGHLSFSPASLRR